MKRRGFLGFLGGAVAAGPSAAKNAMATLPAGLGVDAYVSDYTSGIGSAPGADIFEKGARLTKLRKLLTGGKTAVEKEEEKRARIQMRGTIASQDIAVLHSVSGAHKLRMYAKVKMKLSDEVRVTNIMSSIFYLEDNDTGIW